MAQKVVAFASQKGGVGKTTTAMNFAAVAAESRSVVLVDVDEQESANWWAKRVGDDLPFDIAADTNPRILARIGELDADVIVVDCPGHLDGVGVIPAVLKAADYVVLVTEAAPLAFPPLTNSIKNVVAPSGVPFRVLVNNIDMAKGGAGKLQDAQDSLTNAGIPVFRSFIRSYQVHEEAPGNGELVTSYARVQSNLNAIEDMRRFATELMGDWSFTTRTIQLTDSKKGATV
jgi:chromosome partitioning protein